MYLIHRFQNPLGNWGRCDVAIIASNAPIVVIAERKDNIGPTASSNLATIATNISREYLSSYDPRAIRWIQDFLPPAIMLSPSPRSSWTGRTRATPTPAANR